MSALKYKVGDRVKIKSLDWYNKNKNSNGDVVVLSKVSHFSWCENVRTVFTKDMVKFCGKVVTIENVWTANYSIVEGTYRDGINIDYFTDEMIEGLVEEETKSKFKVGDRVITDTNMKGKIIEVVEEGWYRVEFEPHNSIPQPNGVVPEESMSLVEEEIKPKFKIGDKVKWYNYTCNITSIDTNENTYTYLIKHDDYREDAIFVKWVPESELTFEDDEETKPEPKFKVGDKIKLKSTLLNDIFGVIGYESEGYRITNISNGLMYFMSYSIEHYYELVEEEVGLVDNLSSRWVNEFNLPDGYIFKDERGNEIHALKIVLEKANTLKIQSDNMETETYRELIQEDGKWFVVKKKREYPKTYEECCEIVKVEKKDTLEGEIIRINNYKIALLESFQKLLICRDAYWKLYGEEMGLGKPWEPTNGNGEKVYSIVRCCGRIKKNSICDFSNCYILEFPTKEMRDAFYEYFKKEIEQCKKLL